MRMTLITPPSEPVVSLAAMKMHLRVDHSDDDAVIEAYTAAATAYCEGPRNILRRVLMPQTWELALDEFPTGAVELPVLPVIAIETVTYYDADGVPQPISPSNFYVDNVDPDYGWLVPVTGYAWPTALAAVNSVRIRYQAGYGTYDEDASPPIIAGDVPAAIVHAIKLLTAHYYETREAVSEPAQHEVPLAVEALLRPFRWLVLA